MTTATKVENWMNANRNQFCPGTPDSIIRSRALLEVNQAELSLRRAIENEAWKNTPNGLMAMFG